MITLTIDSNIPDVIRQLDDVRQRQVPFAIALALTTLAVDAQKGVRGNLPRRFTIRRSWVSQGIRTRRATKQRPESSVFTLDEFMVLQEEGGEKRPRRKHLALPAERTARVIPRSKRPRAVLQKPRVFIAPVMSGKKVGGLGVFQRRGKARYPIQFLWRLHPDAAKVNARFHFEGDVHDVVKSGFKRRFGEALGRALASAK